ncbi:MAG: sensor domain-containing diguanylate cyclase [Candidatus Omnitrophota bacterium]|nr:sensor domain-containing diguanylate cyclase [Candidatus Omnitrophota bacterium]MDZ4242611.1 sensor domain-containing diguanylate cyclase [Candidatus Omnitrophota bacterium]
MIQKPKKQFFSSRAFSAALLVFPLISFFVYATYFWNSFFPVIAGITIVNLAALLYEEHRSTRKRAEIGLYRQDYLERLNLLTADIGKERLAIESFQKKIVDYDRLKGLTEKLCMCLSIPETAKALTGEAGELFGQNDSTIILYLVRSREGELAIASSLRGGRHVTIMAKQGDIYDQWIVKNMKPLLIEDVKTDFRFDLDNIPEDKAHPIRSLISSPMVITDKPVGILRVDSPQENSFATDDLRFLSTIGDIGAVAVENAQLYERVEDLAIRDGLTGLYLRRQLLERLSHEISRSLRLRKDVSFLMIDLDDFKKYNDRLGHTAGDIVLRAVALILADRFKEPGNILCRYGGEEFSVLLPDCPKDKAMAMAEEFRRTVEAQSIILRREKTRITVSVGVAAFPHDAQVKEDLIQQADLALYRAKKKGKNQIAGA